ncbi:RNA polymerase II-associated protein 3 [Mortierella sp. GBA30]|nr:RNA polymerase II-associated protein 3 [Mortierella sp. GBA30]
MDSTTLQRIAQWEKTYSLGNKKPLAEREYPPIRPKKDIILEDVRPVAHKRKVSLAESKKALLPLKNSADQNITASLTTSKTGSPKAPLDSGLSRKAYYESWDKFDINKALDEMEKKDVNTLASPKSETSVAAADQSTSKSTAAKVSSKDATSKTSPLSESSNAATAANAEKERGNELFKKGQYLKAIEHYSASMALDPSNPVLPINRAMALLKLEKYPEVERDCTLGLHLDSRNVKALWRRGIARRSLGRPDEARKDFELALTIDPSNRAVKEELNKLKQVPASATPRSKATAKKDEPLPLVTKTTDASPSKKNPSAPHVISSKRVTIKEVENDRASQLFSPSESSKQQSSSGKSQTPAKPKLTTTTSTTSTASNTVEVLPTPSTTAAEPLSHVLPPALSSTPEGESQKAPLAKVQMTAPTTTMDFQRDWKSYSRSNELLYQYIKLIQPEALPAIFKSSFESDYLSLMLTVFQEFYVP